MAWSIVGVSTSVEVTATSHTLTVPAGIAQGDLLVACISSRIASTTSITLPTGGEWTLIGEQKANNVLTTSSALPSAMMAWCVRGASNPNLTFTHPTAPSVAIGHIVAYRGGVTASPRDGAAAAATTAINVTAVSLAGLTTTVANDLIVAMAAGGQEAAWTSFNATSPSGASGAVDTTTAPSATWRKRAEIITTTGGDTSLGVFDAVKTAAGATGNFTVTASIAAGHSIVAGAFKIGVAVSASVTGQAVTASAGVATVSAAAMASVTGQAVTASVGTASVNAIQNISTVVTGQAVTASVGTVTAIVPFTGQRSWFIGSPLGGTYIAETGDDSYALPTGYVTETSGVAVGISVSVDVSGQSVTATTGSVTVAAAQQATASVTGQAATVSVGNVSVTTTNAVAVPVIGQAVTASVGTATVTANQTVGITVAGQAVTAAVGTVTVDIPGAAFTGQRSYFIGSQFGGAYVNETAAISYALSASYVTETSGVAVAAGLISVWTGSAWADKPMMVWTGSTWAQKPVKHWNGSAWV
jgi:hypothetical protein